tara:strand:+ start:23 stop:256 length:234 start_codon:yes stop_codon:yes gene_type:complete
MSNCYDHEYKSNMLDSYYWDNKDEAKKNLSENKIKLTSWYQKQLTLYQNAEDNFDDWYSEYSGGSWEENNINEYKGG